MTWSERIVAAFVLVYPVQLRARFGNELRQLVSDLNRSEEHRGVRGRLRLWRFLLRDVVTTIARERVAALPMRSVPLHGRVAATDSPPYADAFLASLLVLALYIATLAPTVAFWDSGEYLTAAHILGIPHQPGNPLFVMVAHAWEMLLAPFGLPPAVRINLFSAVMSTGAHFFWFLVVYRIGAAVSSDRNVRRIGAAAAVLLSATAFTVWNQSNVNEKVYTISLLTIALITWLLLRWRDTGGSPRWLLLIAFLIALTSTNHLMGVLVAPAVFAYVMLVDWKVLMRPRLWAGALLCVAIGLTPNFFLPLRAAQQPILNSADPRCASLGQAAVSVYSSWLPANQVERLFGPRASARIERAGCAPLSDVLQRGQYGKPSMKLDPTVYPEQRVARGPSLLGAQIANYTQYFNWQWARGVLGSDPLVGGLRPLVTLAFLLLGLLGARAHWQRDRASATYVAILFLTLSLGLVLYMNFEYGYAMARETFPDPEMHEVRERDYFFLIGFSVWALWAGLGLTGLWQRAAQYLTGRVRRAQLVAAPVLAIALVPLGLNWQWASRADDYTARDWAYNVLMSVEPYGVLFTNGDNDTFPLWYLQEVEGIRRDVTVMVTIYLNSPWYARQMRDLTRPCAPGQDPQQTPSRIVCQRPFQPEQMPVALRQAAPPVPKDSILPLSDGEIDQIAAGYYVLRDTVTFKAAGLETTIAGGTMMLPADTFVAAIVQATLGERPIHFTTPAPIAQKLGLFDHTIRRGLTFKLHDGRTGVSSFVPMPRGDLSIVSGSFLDLSATETLLNQVFQQRGRILDLSLPHVDRATTNILLQYAWVHYSAAQAYALRGGDAAMQQHVMQGDWWQRRAGE